MTRKRIGCWTLCGLLLATLGCNLPVPAPVKEPAVTASPPTLPTATQTPTASPSPAATRRPTSTPAPTLTFTPEPPPTAPPPSATVLLEPMNYQRQTANNCGPASVAITLGYYGHWITQHKVNEQIPAGSLTPCDVVLYMPQYGLMSRLYYSPPAGEPVRQLLDNRIPVILNQLLSADSSIRHYRVIRGYDAATSVFIADDPLLGAYFRIRYDTFATISDPGNFIPVYPPEKDSLVQSLMGALGVGEIPCP